MRESEVHPQMITSVYSVWYLNFVPWEKWNPSFNHDSWPSVRLWKDSLSEKWVLNYATLGFPFIRGFPSHEWNDTHPLTMTASQVYECVKVSLSKKWVLNYTFLGFPFLKGVPLPWEKWNRMVYTSEFNTADLTNTPNCIRTISGCVASPAATASKNDLILGLTNVSDYSAEDLPSWSFSKASSNVCLPTGVNFWHPQAC